MKKYYVLGILSLILFCHICSIFVLSNAYSDSITIIADRDAYVDSGSYYSNFGGKDWFLVGGYLGEEESYFHFSFSNLPSNALITKAEASFYIYSVDETMDVRACITDNNWEEYKITWNNKPAHKTTITTFTAAARDHYKIDVTDFIKGNEISICPYTPKPPSYGNCQGSTREGAYNEENKPKLIIEYDVSSTPNTISPNTISPNTIILGIVITTSVIIIIGISIILFSNKKKDQIKYEQTSFYQQQPHTPQDPSSEERSWRYCRECGFQLPS